MAQAKRKTAPKSTASRRRARPTQRQLKVLAQVPKIEIDVGTQKKTPYEVAHEDLLKSLQQLDQVSAELCKRLRPVLPVNAEEPAVLKAKADAGAPLVDAIHGYEDSSFVVGQRIQWLLDNLAI